MSNFEKVPPSPKLAESLRHLGYSVTTAINDIIDNSIDAAATEIKVNIKGKTREPASEINIFDNGSGMNLEEIKTALVMGSETQKSETDLGCFGAGLKTGATSIGRRLSVYSRKDGPLSCYVYDLDVCKQEGDWVIQPHQPTEDEVNEFNSQVGTQSSGTWIRISKIDSKEYKNVKSMLVGLKSKKGIRLTFRKFLEGACNIFINGDRMQPWGYDYLPGHKTLVDSFNFKLNDGTSLGTIKIVNMLDTEQIGTRRQGIVVLRNGRDITPKRPTWHGIRSNNDWELTGIYVIWEVHSTRFDELMGTTLMKDDWKIPQNIADQLKAEINPFLISHAELRKKARTIKTTDNSSVDEKLGSYANNLNSNMKTLRKPDIENESYDSLAPPSKEKDKTSQKKRDSTNKLEKGLRFKGDKEDVWTIKTVPGCGDGTRYYQVRPSQRGRRREYELLLDTNHEWIQKYFINSGFTSRELTPILDFIISDVYMEFKILDREVAEEGLAMKTRFLTCKARVTTIHDPPLKELTSEDLVRAESEAA